MAWGALSKALGAKVEERSGDDGRSTLFIAWKDGDEGQIEVEGEQARWLHLSHLRKMQVSHDAVRSTFAKAGIRRLYCAPQDDRARKALLKNGPWVEVDTERGPELLWEIDGD